jgi:hypothetical protein
MPDNAGGPHLIETPAERTTREKTEDQRRENRYRRLQLWFNGILAIATILTCGIVLYQNRILKRSLGEMVKQSTAMGNTLGEARKQTGFAETSANAAQKALDLTRENFRRAERPYITLAPAGFQGRMELVSTGEHAGHLSVTLALSNYGKSPGVEIGRDARIAIGSAAGKQIRLHRATDTRGRIIPPGDKPTIYAYSEEVVSEQMFNDIRAGKVLVIAYGHVAYTDLLSEPRPNYISEFCTGILLGLQGAEEANSDCEGHTYIK